MDNPNPNPNPTPYPYEQAIIQAIKTLKPEIHALLMEPSKTAGQILNAPLQIANAPLGYTVRRVQQLIHKLDELAEPDAFAKPIQQERRERIWRTIYVASQSTGTEMLDYWTKLIKLQVYATDRELDLSEAVVSALKEMTDTHGRFLREFGDLFEYPAKEYIQNNEALKNTGMEYPNLVSRLKGYENSEIQILLDDLVAIGLVANWSMTVRHFGVSKEIYFCYLTRKGIELLRLGGWEPKINANSHSDVQKAVMQSVASSQRPPLPPNVYYEDDPELKFRQLRAEKTGLIAPPVQVIPRPRE